MLQSLSQTLMVRIARNAERDHQKRGKSRHFEKLEALLTQHIKDRWSVAQYAAALSITSTQLSRITRAEAGVSASKLIDMWLFQEAQRSLAYTRMSVAEVGYTLGFEDPAYFSRAFRRHYGQSPSEYRQGLGISSDA
ncbi:MAG: AraC family transcriptional regulator, partial [Pseudomonadota bacterium]|nr:AraC family transcriptional regulator [Pseudomonadota bacterium]